jgi:hypothetical protein
MSANADGQVVIFRVVINASALPDPKEVSYDLLLTCAPAPECPYALY